MTTASATSPTAGRTTRGTAVALPAALSLIAGVTDVTSWLLLGGFFSAHVTGNLVVVAADVVTGTPPNIAAVLAIPVFILTTAIATVVARRVAAATARSSSLPAPVTITRVLLGSQAVLLIAAAALSFTTRASADPHTPVAIVIGLCAVCAMAAQNAYLHLVPLKAASTGVMTGNLVTATVALVDIVLRTTRSASARQQWTATWPLLAGFIGGCLVGAAGASLFSDRAAVVPAVLATLLFIVLLARRAPRAPQQEPTTPLTTTSTTTTPKFQREDK